MLKIFQTTNYSYVKILLNLTNLTQNHLVLFFNNQILGSISKSSHSGAGNRVPRAEFCLAPLCALTGTLPLICWRAVYGCFGTASQGSVVTIETI